MTQNEFETIVKESVSKSEVCRKLGYPINGTGLHKFNSLVKKFNIDISHFSHKAAMIKFSRKWETINKACPVCGKVFETKKDHPREQFTCSHSCSNTHFAIRRNKPEAWKNYRTICFKHWEKKCILCGFDKVVEVHHLDYNNKNNNKNNLVPVCPNHHQMIHTNEWGVQTVKEIEEKLRGVG
jgi:uncharacterized C2H2 Zn-finger protein